MQSKTIYKFLKAAEKIGKEKYQKEFVVESFRTIFNEKVVNPEEFFRKKMKDRKSTLIFILNWSFLRGRNNELSEFYCDCATEAINSFLEEKNFESLCNAGDKIANKFEAKVKDKSSKEKRRTY